MSDSKSVEPLRRQAFGAVVLICVQSGIGMFVNLFVSIPKDHAGANPSNYFSGSMRSVAWAIGHGAVALALHMVLGLLLGIMVIGIVARAFAIGRASLIVWSVLGASATIGAGFTGAGFLDFNQNVSSFFMALLAFASLICFAVMVYLPSRSARIAPSTSDAAAGATNP
ncbi:MAG: hypothetical protein WCF25_08355 [Acidimicrobiales bacterium]